MIAAAKAACPYDGFVSADSPWNGVPFDVIYEDKPWKYGNWSDKAHGAAAAHYVSLDLKGLIALRTSRYAAEACTYFQWATWPKLDEAIAVGKADGWRYITGFPWIKYVPSYADGYLLEAGRPMGGTYLIHPLAHEDTIGKDASVGGTPFHVKQGCGFVVYQCSEPLLVWRRGDPRKDKEYVKQVGLMLGDQPRTFWHPIGKHSKKPVCIRAQITAEFPLARKLELFATDFCPGWTSWGSSIGTVMTPEGVFYADRGLAIDASKAAGVRLEGMPRDGAMGA